MRVRQVIRGLLWAYPVAFTACSSGPSADWVLLSEDSEGRPAYVDSASIHMSEDGIAVYTRVVGDPLSEDRVEFLQALDCVNLRWAFLTLDESSLDAMSAGEFSSEEWSLLALTPANQVLLDAVCPDFSPTRWIRVLRTDAEDPGELKEVWVDTETIQGPGRDSILTEIQDLGVSDQVYRSWSRWYDASPDSGFLMTQADVACDKESVRYLENSKYSMEGELVDQAETTDLWYNFFRGSFEEAVFSVVCEMGEFFEPEITPGTSPEGG